ncbi:PTPA-CTERM sorting domain-containing protein [Leptolyngbya sp. FACHB-261]|uniref:PTPA-CTERM sorting domain-containing protein n=1 Tax=Leptolyngbya sp. FACHB-261 TaxID=2692806 RepID=UPI001686E12F|nr:PTPA-CTERM sorting domain-containing protein [Leptolyngbya sp. FACHB-261]MBD2103111.1 PTPA-CTERM sorting domain-containing protein [Leptolyngbya sp. FACHB-261]
MFNLKHAAQAAAVSVLLTVTAGIPAQAAIISGKISGTVTQLIGGYVPQTVQLGSPIRGSYSYDSESAGAWGRASLTAFDLSIGDNPFRFDLSSVMGVVLLGAGSGGSDLLSVDFRNDEAGTFFGFPGPIGYGSLRASATEGDGIFSLMAGRYDDLEYYGYIESDNIVARPDGSTPAIPAPALMPGLVGLGMAAWRKQRQNQDTIEVS